MFSIGRLIISVAIASVLVGAAAKSQSNPASAALGQELGRIPGLWVSGRNGNVRSTRGGCVPDVFIDGLRIQSFRGQPTVGNMEVSEVGAVEYYAVGQIPAQFNLIGKGCGAILIWTRER